MKKLDFRIESIHQKIAFVICFGLLMLCLFIIDEANPLPGWLTLVPVTLTAICLACSYFSVSQRLTRLTKIPFLIGQSSYAIYLVHWPLVVSLGYLARENVVLGSGFLILIVVFGYVVHKHVEQRFLLPKPIFRFSVGVLLILTIPFLMINHSGGFPGRFSSGQLEILNSASLVNGDRRHCLNVIGRDDNAPLNSLCTHEVAQDNYLMWGDSHLEVFRSYFLADDLLNISFLGVAGCPPLLMVDRKYGRKNCDEYAESALEFILANDDRFSVLIIGARFSAYVNGNTSHLGRAEGGLHQLIIDVENPTISQINAFRNRLSETLEILSETQLQVVILGGIPEFGESIPRQMFRDSVFSGKLSFYDDVFIPISDVNNRLRVIDDYIRSQSEKYENVHFFDPKEVLCDDYKCSGSLDSQPLYFDNDHLNKFGVDIASDGMIEYIHEIVKR
jgi:hypothetical protein